MQQNDNNAQDEDSEDDAQEEESDGEASWKADMRADASTVLTVRDAKDRVKMVKKEIQALQDRPFEHHTEANREMLNHKLKVLRQRRRYLRAARAAASIANDNPGGARTENGVDQAGARSLDVSETDRRVASAPPAGSGGQEGSEDEIPQPPPRRRLRRRDRQTSQRASNRAGLSSRVNPPPRQRWPHVPNKNWPVRGIKHERRRRYLIAWGPTDGIHWDDSWERKDCANAKAVRDWKRRKNSPEMREYVDGDSEVEYV